MKARICLLLFISLWNISFTQAQNSQDFTLYYPNVLIYEYEYQNTKSELWIYHNPETGQLLYTAPGDDMLDAVVSYPGGTYTLYLNDENGEFTQQSQYLELVNKDWKRPMESQINNELKSKTFDILHQKQAAISIQINYQKATTETIWVSDAIRGNAHQLYGFYHLLGDAQIRLPIDYSYFVSKDHWIVDIDNPYIKLKLIAYEPNPYWFNTSKYKS